jgi:two-component system sensor histidine kinase GlrK
MKVSTKILLGYSLLVLLMVFGLGYQLMVLDQVQEVSVRLSDVNSAGLEVTQLGENLRVVDEFTEKYLLVSAEYEAQLAQFRAAFDETLRSMETVVRTDGERRALAQLATTWREAGFLFEQARASRPPGTHGFMPVRLDELILRMNTEVLRVADEVHDAFVAEVELAQATRERARWVAWVAAVAAVSLAGGIGLSMSRSIRGSFRRFMGATAFVAAGEFEERVPEDQNDEFGELARSFNMMAARLEELDRLKKDFVSSVSHELKSPMASSREIVHLLLDEVPGPLNDEQRRLLELSIRSSRRLSAMVGSLLDVARMDAGTMRYEKERRDLRSLVASALEEFEVTANDRGLRIEALLEEVEPVHCDADRVMQVVGNLVDNALKFSRRGSSIAVRLENVGYPGDANLKGGVMLSIIDAGPGIPDSDKQRVFARFQQVKSDGAPRQGVGLGLAISRSIVEDHGGRIWVEDNPHGGSVFRFVLPSVSVSAPTSTEARVLEV